MTHFALCKQIYWPSTDTNRYMHTYNRHRIWKYLLAKTRFRSRPSSQKKYLIRLLFAEHSSKRDLFLIIALTSNQSLTSSGYICRIEGFFPKKKAGDFSNLKVRKTYRGCFMLENVRFWTAYVSHALASMPDASWSVLTCPELMSREGK